MINKTMFSKLVLLLIFSVLLSHFSYSQKQVQQFFFPQDGYVLGAKNHLLDVGYTDGTQGSAFVSQAVIKNLDADKKGLQTFSVEYGGVTKQYKCIVDSRRVNTVSDSEFKSIVEQCGFNTAPIMPIEEEPFWVTFMDYYIDFVWIVKPEKFYVDCDVVHYCGQPLKFVGYVNDNIVVTPDTIVGFNPDQTGRQDVTFKCAGLSFKTTIENIGVEFISDFSPVLYLEPEHNTGFNAVYTDGTKKAFEFKDAVVFGFDTIRNDHSVKNREQEITIKFGNREQKWLVAVAFFYSLTFPKMLYRGDSSQTFNIAYYDGKVLPVSIKEASFSGLDLNRAGLQNFVVKYSGFSYSAYNVEVVDIDSVKLGAMRFLNDEPFYEYHTNKYISSLTVFYHDGTMRIVDINNAKISGLDLSKPGLQTVTINYAGKQFVNKVNVWERPVYFDFSNLSDTIFQYRTLSGTFNAIYRDGTTKKVDVSDAYCQIFSEKIGTCNALVRWHSHTQRFDVEVITNTKRPVSLNFSRVKTDVLVFDRLRGYVKAVYSDGSFDLFDVKYADFALDTETPGKKKIKISWHGFNTSLSVNVKEDIAKPILKDGFYQLESVNAVKWFIRAMIAGHTDGHDGVLSSKLFGNFNKFAAPVQPNVFGFTITTTVKGFTQSTESRSARFSAAQKLLIKSAFENGSKIFIEDVHGQTIYGETIDLGSLEINF